MPIPDQQRITDVLRSIRDDGRVAARLPERRHPVRAAGCNRRCRYGKSRGADTGSFSAGDTRMPIPDQQRITDVLRSIRDDGGWRLIPRHRERSDAIQPQNAAPIR